MNLIYNLETQAISLFLEGGAVSEVFLSNNFNGYKNISIKSPAISSPSQGVDLVSVNSAQIIGVGYNGMGSLSSNHFIFGNGTYLSIINSGAVGYLSETGFSIGLRSIQNLLPYKGKISEFIFCNLELSLSEKSKLEGYLAYKWSLVNSLDSSHPYKNTPPTLRQ